MSTFDQQSLDLHRQHHGKIAISGQLPLETKDDLSIAYTPGVAAVSQAIADDPSQVAELTIKRNSIAVVTDGSAVLGLGNIGPQAALPVMEGKALLFKKFADIDAWPICLATQDVDEIVETVKRLAPGFGGINLEDIAAPRCFAIEQRLKDELDIPVMHDDQWGTAVVVLAGLLNALKLRGTDAAQARVVLNGAGAAGIAIAKLLLAAGFSQLVLCDSRGPIYKGRPDTEGTKADIAELTNMACHLGLDQPGCAVDTLENALQGADVFIGISKANLVTAQMVKAMNDQPIIFAMANPVPEIMPDLAHEAGALIVATGRSDFPNQVNNVLAFPGIFRGALDGQKKITQAELLAAAHALAAAVAEPTVEKIIPGPFDPGVAEAVAAAVKSA